MDPVRIIYHAAPGPASDGSIVEVPPVDLGTDSEFALAWIRRRLGLVGVPDENLLRFKSEIVPLPEPIDPAEALAALAAGPPKNAAPAARVVESGAAKPASRSRFGRKTAPKNEPSVGAETVEAAPPAADGTPNPAGDAPGFELPPSNFGLDDE